MMLPREILSLSAGSALFIGLVVWGIVGLVKCSADTPIVVRIDTGHSGSYECAVKIERPPRSDWAVLTYADGSAKVVRKYHIESIHFSEGEK